MGLIRGGLVVIAGVLLFISILVGSLFLTLSSSLEYENVVPEFTSAVKNTFTGEFNLESGIIKQSEAMNFYCKNYPSYVFSQGEYTFDIPCEIILQGPDKILDEGMKQLVKKIYYTDYDCEFLLGCSKKYQQPLFLVSEQAKNYWNDKFYLALGISAILIAIMFILAEHRLDLFTKIGGILIISSLPFMKLDSIVSFFNFQFIQFLSIFVSKSYDVFLKVLILGIIFVATGLIIKLFKFGFKLNSIFQKKEVSEETKKEDNQSSQKEKTEKKVSSANKKSKDKSK
jgi:hypothetical protein